MTDIDTRHVAAELKRRLTAEFPGVKFRVRRGGGTARAWISMSWTDGPDDHAVAAITELMKGPGFDAAQERGEPTGHEVTVTIDGERVTGKPVLHGIQRMRMVSDSARAEAEALWSDAHGGAAPEGPADGFMCEGHFISYARAPLQVCHIATDIVLPRRWAATARGRGRPA